LRTQLLNVAAALLRVVEERNIVISSNTYTGEGSFGVVRNSQERLLFHSIVFITH